MKKTILGLVVCAIAFSSNNIIAQGLQNYGNFQWHNNTQIALHNSSFVNTGAVDATSSGNTHLLITGNSGTSNPFISSNSLLQLQNFSINRSSNQCEIQSTLRVNNNLNMIAGNLILNNAQLALGSTGVIVGENINSKIVGINNGYIQSNFSFSSALNNINQGNIGIEISTAANPGNAIMERLYQPSSNIPGSRINRYYKISVQNNNNLNATVRFYYDDSELNGANENNLSMYSSVDTISWLNIGKDAFSTSLNYVEKSGINSLNYFALSSTNPLPLNLISFTGQQFNNKANLHWNTKNEESISTYQLERKTFVESEFKSIAIIAAQNKQSATYNFIDSTANEATNCYRLKIIEKNGLYSFSNIVKLSITKKSEFIVYPNPVKDILSVYLQANATKAFANIYNQSGQLKMGGINLNTGNNSINVEVLSKGIYLIQVNTNTNSYIEKIIKL